MPRAMEAMLLTGIQGARKSTCTVYLVAAVGFLVAPAR